MVQEKYAILGQGAVGPFGAGSFDLKARIAERFELKGGADSQFPLTASDTLTAILPKTGLRRTDHFSRLAIAAASMALESAGDGVSTEKMGLIIGTGYGAVTSTCQFKDTFVNRTSLGASPTQFTKSVHNQACSQLAMFLKIHGSVTTICQHYFPFQTALQLACLWLDEGRSETVLIGGVDEYPEHLNYCRTRLLDEDSAHGGSLVRGKQPGEGAAFFILSKGHDSSQPKPLISKVRFANRNDIQSALESCDCLVDSENTNSFTTTSRDNLGFRSVFGSFPTASALDCFGVSLFADKGSKCGVFESRGNSSCIVEIIGGETCE